MTLNRRHPERPRSATHPAVAAAGAIGFLCAILALRLLRPFNDGVLYSAVFVIALTTTAIFVVDLGWQKVHRRASTGLDPAHNDPSWPRTFLKLAGLLGSIAFIGLGYWLFPEYHGDLYGNYRDFLGLLIAPWLVLALPYIYWVDRRMRAPCDGYWQMGMLVTMRWQAIDRGALIQHLLGWTIKGYFLALMFSYMCNDLKWLLLFDFGSLYRFGNTYEFAYRFVFFLDVGIATLGYLMSFRLTDTHLRSAEPTMLGWIVTLACYEPFWSLLSRHYLPYDTGHPWGAWLASRPSLYIVWGSTILALSAIYVWATVSFGARFSNLTHRGIITSGPYRWTRHPAYLAKNLSWWMISVPFMPRGDAWDTVARCAMLLGVNFLYFMRAKTEERHLSRDPVYVQYALWIEAHGVLRFAKRLPLLRHLTYKAPQARGATA